MEWTHGHVSEQIQVNGNTVSIRSGEGLSLLGSHLVTTLSMKYFEIKHIEENFSTKGRPSHRNPLAVGLSPSGISLAGREPGLGNGAIAYYSDGGIFKGNRCNEVRWRENGIRAWTVGNVIGCGIDDDGFCYFTLNGKKVETVIDVKGRDMYPLLYIYKKGSIETNFGDQPFFYERANDKGFFHDWKVANEPEKPKLIDSFGYLNDIKFVSKDGEEIGCHRLILSIRSSVFAAMFKSNTETSDVIQIPDFEGSTIRQMISFIYTDTLEKDYSVDFDLLLIAHKYDIRQLEVTCENILIKELTAENAFDAWTSANTVSSDKIIAACKLFFVQHWLEVEKTRWYATITEEKKGVLIKLMTSLIEEREDAVLNAALVKFIK